MSKAPFPSPRFEQCLTCAHGFDALYSRECGEGAVAGEVVDGLPVPPEIVHSSAVDAWIERGTGQCPGWRGRDLPADALPAARRLLALVREAYGDPTITAQYHPSEGDHDRKRWRVWHNGCPIAYGVTEAEALVTALERSADRATMSAAAPTRA